MGIVGKLAWRGASFVYGFVMLGLMLGIAYVRDGAFMSRMSEEEKRELETARKQYWDLATSPIEGYRHAFCNLPSGAKLHYVVNQAAGSSTRAEKLVIFIHGFPDSYLLWHRLLSDSSSNGSCIKIAVDLPGYGGSSSLAKYDPESVLEAMTAFVLEIRKIYLADNGRVIMVTHDWGTIIGARLASEARELADRWILTSAIIPSHVKSNIETLIASTRQMLHTYTQQPSTTSLVRSALSTLSPVLSQLQKSFYIFIFNLPSPFANFFATFGNYWFMRLTHGLQSPALSHTNKEKHNAKDAAYLLCASSGPDHAQLSTKTPDGDTYPSNVSHRIRDHGMSAKIRLYRESLATGPWEKSLQTIIDLSELGSSSSTPFSPTGSTSLFDDGPAGALKAPATLLYGEKDPAFSRQLGLSGISDYLARNSQVVVLKGSGHWLPNEDFGSSVIRKAVEGEISGDGKPLWHLQGVDKERVEVLVDKK